MNKALKYGIIIFLLFFISSIVVYCIFGVKESEKENNNEIIKSDVEVLVDVKRAVEQGEWFDITEEDKITLALGAETNIISEVMKYLKDNKIAVFFVYGGPFDSSLNGNYIICTGFNSDGRAKVLYPDDNFQEEWRYSFEGVIEFSQKVMLFEM